jgi:GDP-mannose 6-dehydrogenase
MAGQIGQLWTLAADPGEFSKGVDDMSDKIVIVGYGRVGQANALALSIMGYSVFYYDAREPKRHYLTTHAAVYNRVTPITDIRTHDSARTIYIVCIGDNVSIDGEQDISEIKASLADLKSVQGQVILRSTILPDRLSKLSFHYYVPEFMREKRAVDDCLNPAWMVVGRNCADKLPRFLETWLSGARKVFVGSPSEAAFIKYLSNLWNATRIAFVNEIGSVVGAPVVSDNLDKINRVIDFVFEGGAYLRYGNAFGGTCLPKDIRAFLKWCHDKGSATMVLDGVSAANAVHYSRRDHARLPEWFS